VRITVVLLAASCALSAVSGRPLVEPVMLPGGGGPDSFGYRYLDSDTVCPGAPTFNWVSIKGVGTRITTLADDNDAGPFQLGFEFPYYWYRVTSCYVGSNGLMAFHEHALQAFPGDTIPDPWPPNNFLAPLMCDLDCSAGGSPHGSVWYWTSADADSFIVEYDSIRFWSTGGNNTFQIILSKPDSTITFQYKEQSGAPFGGWVSNQTGIENVTGTIGLNYLSGMYPPQNMYHDSLAVLFIPPESSAMHIHETGARGQRGTMNVGPTVVRGVLFMIEARGEKREARSELLDISGRRVLDLKSGANDVSRLAPGVYFVLEPSAVSREPSAVSVRKVVLTR
jgi:hypothetical protein